MEFSRRSFLRRAAASAFLPVPGVLLRAAQAAGEAPGETLVVLQLSGGNDGLNTLVPYEDDAYRRARPTLGLAREEVLRIASGSGGPGLGFHPAMGTFHDLYERGLVAVVSGVGYPGASRSHFRSMDIWHTARVEPESVEDGWIGRSLAAAPGELAGLHIGGGRLPLALAGKVPVPSIESLDFLDFLASGPGRRLRGLLRDLHRSERAGRPEEVRRLATATVSRLETLVSLRGRPVPVDYPATGLAARLRLAGQLIAGRFPARVLYLAQDGYDTHARQKDAHAALLRELSDALGAFFEHLEKVALSSKVTVLVFSEFGRRVAENGSLGTDHGVAAPVFVISGRAAGGLHGAPPTLEDLDEGDLRHRIDFRQIYATLLEEVLGVRATPILGGDYEKVEVLRVRL